LSKNGKRPLLPRQPDRRGIGRIAQRLRDAGRHGAAIVRIVAQAQHHQRAAQAKEAQADAALGGALVGLLRQRPLGRIQRQVQHAHPDARHPAHRLIVEFRALAERMLHKTGQVQRTEVAASVARQRLFAARIGGAQGFAVVQVVLGIDAVHEQHARFRMVIGRGHHLVPQLARGHAAIDPLAVVALAGAGGQVFVARLRLVHQFELAVGRQRAHEAVRDADRQVEIAESAIVLGGDEVLDIGMVDAQHAHLGATAGAGRFDRLAGSVEYFHVRHRSRGARLRPLHLRAGRPDGAEVVAHATAAAHGFRRFGDGGIDARQAIGLARYGIADRLHEAVHQGGLQPQADGGIDTAGWDEAVFLRPQELLLKVFAQLGRFQRRQRARYAAADVDDVPLLPFRVFFAQYVE
jgi:hypothetical protein